MGAANSDKMIFIGAYFDELERKIQVLSHLAETGYSDEALTLCLVYIDGLAQRLCWPSEQNGVNFVRALSDYSNDTEMGLVHPLQLRRELDRLNASWQPISAAIRAAFPGPTYELLPPSAVTAAVATGLDTQQRRTLESNIWRGTIAAVAYYRMRNPAVHALGTASHSFENTTYAGYPAKELDLARLQLAAMSLVAEARRRSETKGDWFGNDLILF